MIDTHNNQLDKQAREEMVKTQVEARGIDDSRVLAALRIVPRHLFIPPYLREEAYQDRPLPIGYNQTISQPYIVGFMSEALAIKPADRVLEIGTGSGYQAAILSQMCQEVYTIEIIEPLAVKARTILQELGYKNVHIKIGDGYHGWLEHAPFEAIIITAAAREIPFPLLDQLKLQGRLIMPMGPDFEDQNLIKVTKTKEGIQSEFLAPVQFVPFIGH